MIDCVGLNQLYYITLITLIPILQLLVSLHRLLIAIAAIFGLEIHQMDVKTIFLNGELDEEIYIEQSESFNIPAQEHKVCKLVKSLYGLKQAPK